MSAKIFSRRAAGQSLVVGTAVLASSGALAAKTSLLSFDADHKIISLSEEIVKDLELRQRMVANNCIDELGADCAHLFAPSDELAVLDAKLKANISQMRDLTPVSDAAKSARLQPLQLLPL